VAVHRGPGRFLILALAAAGALHWWVFFSGGRFDISVSDWPRQAAYFDILAGALRGGYLPLQLSAPLYDMGGSFFANLEAPLTPQTWLFALAGPGAGSMLSVIFMAWVGLYGCVRLARRCGLSGLTFVLLVLLTGYNGYIVSHVAAGHLAWVGCYVLPLVFEGVLAMHAAGGSRSRAPVAMALVLAALVMQGSLHVAVITWMVLLLLALTRAGLRTHIAACLAWFVALSAVRLLPAAAVFWPGGRPWLADGYGSLAQVVEGLTLVHPPSLAVSSGATLLYGERDTVLLRWFEFDMYVGIVGGLVLLAFVMVPMVRRLFRAAAAETGPPLSILDLPLAAVAALACWRVYGMVIPAPVSLLSVERVPSRLLGVAVIFALMVASVRFEAWWRSAHRNAVDGVLAGAAIVVLALQLAYHSFVVSPVREGAYAVTLEFADLTHVAVTASVYTAALAVGLVVTLVSATLAVRRLRPRATGAR
jgi:hypothetical protein